MKYQSCPATGKIPIAFHAYHALNARRKKKTPAKSVFFAFGENYASYFLKSNAPLCPPNPKFVLIATFTSAFLATFGT